MGVKPQHGGKVPTFEFQDIIPMWLIINKVEYSSFYVKIFSGLVLIVGSSFLLDPILNTNIKPFL